MTGKKKTTLPLAVGVILLVLVVLGWFIFGVFEGEKPLINLHPFPEYLSKSHDFTLSVSDKKRGLKRIQVTLVQEGRDIDILKISLPFEGLFNKGGTHRYEAEFSVDPSELNLAQGRVDLNVRVWDHSRRRGGDGNISMLQHKMIVDTIPPAIRAVSRSHYINAGGTCLVVYQTSSDSVKSGVFVDESFFKGYPAGDASKEGYHVCYFAAPPIEKQSPKIHLWTEDKAKNRSTAGFYYHVRRKNFRTEKINITDRFLNKVLPYFSMDLQMPEATDTEKFLHINRTLRKENNLAFRKLWEKTASDQLWNGEWMRLENAANMARFGDRRLYCRNGNQIDKQVHQGVDLASLANSKVQAANNGRVIFAERLGIYGNTVVLDHGQGLASAYSHLSQISVEPGQEVIKGQEIGLTGQTGLAGGDHLHFGVMVGGQFVDPIEWWDSHWIQDNIVKKLALLEQ